MGFIDFDKINTRIIAVNGMSSSGKGTFAERVASTLPNASVLFGDSIVWNSVLKRPRLQKEICDRTFCSFEEFIEYYLKNESHELLLRLENNPYLTGDFESEVVRLIDEKQTSLGEMRYIVIEWTLMNVIESIWNKAFATVTLKTSPDVQRMLFLKHTQNRGDKPEALDIRNNKARPLIRDGKFIIQNNGDDSFFRAIDYFCRGIQC